MRTIAAAALLAMSAAAGFAAAQPLDAATAEKVRDAVIPSAEEGKWREIPWRPTLWEAVGEAGASGRPILLWAMNGHPLACT